MRHGACVPKLTESRPAVAGHRIRTVPHLSHGRQPDAMWRTRVVPGMFSRVAAVPSGPRVRTAIALAGIQIQSSESDEGHGVTIAISIWPARRTRIPSEA